MSGDYVCFPITQLKSVLTHKEFILQPNIYPRKCVLVYQEVDDIKNYFITKAGVFAFNTHLLFSL